MTMKNTLINPNDLKNLLSLWGYDKHVKLTAENISYDIEKEKHIWTINNDYILKMTNSEYELKNNIYIAKLLSKEGIKAQRIVPTLKGEEYVTLGNKYFILFTKLKGEVLKDYFSGDYLKRGFYLGQCVAKLHKGLKNITTELKEDNKLWDNNMINELNGWSSREINKYIPTCTLPKEEINNFNKIYLYMTNDFEELYKKLPRQIIHRDVHGENMIFQNEKLVGYIDFDLSQINARIYDICYLCTGALVKVFDNMDKREKWVGFSKEVIKGYNTINPLTPDEQNSIKPMFYLIELIMVAYFGQNNSKEIADTNIKIINWIDSVW